MASESTMDKMYQMRLSMMARAYREQEEALGIREMSFDERLAMIVAAEWDARRANKRTGLLRAAAFPGSDANVADVIYDDDGKLDKGQILELSNCKWIYMHRNVIVSGASGAGKCAGRGGVQRLLLGQVRQAAGVPGHVVRGQG